MRFGIFLQWITSWVCTCPTLGDPDGPICVSRILKYSLFSFFIRNFVTFYHSLSPSLSIFSLPTIKMTKGFNAGDAFPENVVFS
jgi:hypothetical protein